MWRVIVPLFRFDVARHRSGMWRDIVPLFGWGRFWFSAVFWLVVFVRIDGVFADDFTGFAVDDINRFPANSSA